MRTSRPLLSSSLLVLAVGCSAADDDSAMTSAAPLVGAGITPDEYRSTTVR